MSLSFTDNNYWEFTNVNPREYGPYSVVDEYEMGAFDLTRIWKGEHIDVAALAKVRLWVDGDKEIEDSFDNPVGWRIISEQFVALLEQLNVQDEYELIPAPLYDAQTKLPIPGYHILNPLNLIECMDIERSGAYFMEDIGVWASTTQCMYLHRNKIPRSASLFRVKEHPSTIVFRGNIVAEYYRRHMTGAWFMHLPTEAEEYIDNE